MPEIEGAFTIERSLRAPDKLICHEDYKSVTQRITRQARQQQHMLQRSQLVKFVNAAPSDRAARIEALLDLAEVGKTRRSLRSVSKEMRNLRQTSDRNLNTSRSDITAVLDLDSFDSETALLSVNQYRAALGLSEIVELSRENIIGGVGSVLPIKNGRPSPAFVLEYVTRIDELIGFAPLEEFSELEALLRTRLEEIRGDERLLRSLQQVDLIRRGIDLISTDACPLCDLPWNQTQLADHLKSKIHIAERAEILLKEIDGFAEQMMDRVNQLLTRISSVLDSNEFLTDVQAENLSEWHGQLNELSSSLEDSLHRYSSTDTSASRVPELYVTERVRNTILDVRELLVERSKTVKVEDSLLESAHTKLVLMADKWPRYLIHMAKFQTATEAYNRAVGLVKAFEDSRNEVLDDIYSDISQEFTRVYRRLHGSDENEFYGKLYPRDAGVQLDVDFFGRGSFPPNALHSEGHQDSMGICLFLVLCNSLSDDQLELLLLDDVVMSVDIGHRKALATLLKEEFDDRQIFVVTHDRIWVEQLRRIHFATKKNIVELLRWDIHTGPSTMFAKDVWDRIDSDLEINDVNAAAARLRRWAESFFRHVCDTFRIPVRYRIDHLWTLSDFFDPACGEIKTMLKKAKINAQNRKDQASFMAIDNLDKRRGTIRRTVDKERWMVNTAVHFNPSENLSPHEFRDVVEAFRDFHDTLHCDDCSRILVRTENNEFIMCGCGNICWPIANL